MGVRTIISIYYFIVAFELFSFHIAFFISLGNSYYLSFCFIGVIFAILAAVYHLVIFRIAVVILFYLNAWHLAKLCCSGSMDHDNSPIMVSSFLMCFIKVGGEEKRNFLILRLIQISLLGHYFISGVWKIRHLDTIFSLDYLQKVAFEHVVNAIFEGKLPILATELLFFENYPLFLGLGLGGILIFQLTTFIPIFFNRLFFIYGIMALLFHLSTAISMGIYSINSAITIILFLLWWEREKKVNVKE